MKSFGVPCYSVPELMNALPFTLQRSFLEVIKQRDDYVVRYINQKPLETPQPIKIVENTNLAEALSDMAIRLLENNLLPISDK